MLAARLKLCGCAAGLACLLAISSAKADIIFCNKFAHVVYAAMAYPQDEGSWIWRGWMALKTGECSQFVTALHVKMFYYRGESESYRDASGKSVSWGSDKKFAILENGKLQLLERPGEGPQFEPGGLLQGDGNRRGRGFCHGHFRGRRQVDDRHSPRQVSPTVFAAREAGYGPSRQPAFFGPTVANGALRTWLDLQLAPPNRD